MTKRTKRLLFYSAVVVFALLSYVIILYAQGYKYSFSEAKFFRTGSIFVKANEDAKVYIGDKFLSSTSFFGNSYTINGLLPGEYTVILQRDNFTSWQKKISVEEGLVREFSKILLLPSDETSKQELKKEIQLLLYPPVESSPTVSSAPSKTPKPTSTLTPTPVTTQNSEPFYIKSFVLYRTINSKPVPISSGVAGFDISPDGQKIVWWNTNNEVWVIWLSDINYPPYKKTGDKEFILRFPETIKNAAFFRGNDYIVVDSSGYKVIEIDKHGGLNLIEI